MKKVPDSRPKPNTENFLLNILLWQTLKIGERKQP